MLDGPSLYNDNVLVLLSETMKSFANCTRYLQLYLWLVVVSNNLYDMR
jgi:hypothetical protein